MFPARRVGLSCRALARCGALRRVARRARVYWRRRTRGGKLQPFPVYLDQAQLLGRRHALRIGPGTVAGGCAQVGARRHGGISSAALRPCLQVCEPGRWMTALSRSSGQRLAAHRRLAAGSSAITIGLSIIAMGLPPPDRASLQPCPPAGRARLPRPAAGRASRRRQRPRAAPGHPLSKPARHLPPAPTTGPTARRPVGGRRRPARPRAAVQPRRHRRHQDRGMFGQIRQQCQDGDPR